MIKHILIVIVCVFNTYMAKSQNMVRVDGDRFTIVMSDNEPLFYDSYDYIHGLRMVDGPGLVMASNMWITGYDENDSLRGAAATFRPRPNNPSKSGFVPGTINSDTSKAASSIVLVTAREIENHKSNYPNPNYTMPYGIAEWPANGDTTIGEMWQMAPFIDLNENSVYEPQKGEYPDIIGEECIYLIKNDLAPEFPRAIGMELHFMISMFDVNVELSNVLDNTVLLNTTLYHRGSARIDTLQVATWFDADLGNFRDDYVSSSERFRAMVMYNGDNNDETFNQAHRGFGENPPAFAMGSMFCDLWGGIFANQDELEQALQAPVSFDEYHFFSKAVWRDTTCLIDINAGHVSYTNSTDTYNATRFVFDGRPGSTGWTEAAVQRKSGDRQAIPILLPKKFYPNDKISYTLALHLAGNQSNTASENAILAYESLESIENLLLERYGDHPLIQASTDCSTVPVDRGCDPALSIDELTENSFSIYPNPSSGEIHFEFAQPVREIAVINTLGQKIKQVEYPKTNTTLNLPPGQYIAQIWFENGAVANEKIVVR